MIMLKIDGHVMRSVRLKEEMICGRADVSLRGEGAFTVVSQLAHLQRLCDHLGASWSQRAAKRSLWRDEP